MRDVWSEHRADEMTQMRVLAKKPHVIVATPGRLVYHLENMKGCEGRGQREPPPLTVDKVQSAECKVSRA